MPSDLQRVAQGLVDSLNQVPQVVAYLQRTAVRCRENAALVAQLAGQTGTTAAAQLDDAARRCEEAAHFLSMAPPKALGWAQHLVSVEPSAAGRPGPPATDAHPPTLGTGGQRDDDLSDKSNPEDRKASGSDQPSDRKAQPEAEPGAGGDDEIRPRPTPSAQTSKPPPAPFIEEIYKRLPKRPNDEGPTRGILTMPDGSKPIGLISGTKGPGAGAPGLTGRTALLDVARIHTEGHAAALMRRLGAAREMTLYLNNKPCPKRWGCARTLKYQLPPGAKLTIYYPGGHDVYIGEEGQPE